MKRLLRACFSLNKFILEKHIKNKSFYIILIYKNLSIPRFQDINRSIKKIFNKIKKDYG
ncbi:hypothetical protein [Blattabacterium cuenoti]|uniref:hypothetical protein n=1 Tax=Blattabacterium cuenoti TaxID=1653831 RepID=UPI00163D2752|nr:hypothetical protein [Blattabacterium cuenoti]